MPDELPVRPPAARIPSAAVLVAGLLLSLAAVVALAFLGWFEFGEAIDRDRERAELQARVLADQAERAVANTSVVLRYVSEQLGGMDQARLPERADQMMAQALVALPFVRSIYLLDDDGLVLASSSPVDVGMSVATAPLGALPAPGTELLGSFVPGRSLAALARNPPGPVAAEGVGFIPLLRGLQPRNGHGARLLVALVNPDSFSSFQALTLQNPRDVAYLLNYQGMVLASSGAGAWVAGSPAPRHPLLDRHLPQRGHASYVGAGLSGGRQVVAFRAATGRPLVAVVEHPHTDTVQRWLAAIGWFGAAAGLAVLFLATMTVVLHRSLRARERTDEQLGAARQEVTRRERELQVLVTSVQELLFRTDALGQITYVNTRWLALRGQPVDMALGRPLPYLVEAPDRPAVVQLLAPGGDTGVRHAGARMRSGDGQLRQLEFAVVPLRDAAGVLQGFAGSAVDVTERLAAQQALEHQLKLVALLLEISPLPVATFDSDGCYLSVNRAWEEFMGRHRDLVVGRVGASFMEEADARLHRERDAALWRSGGTLRYEAKVRHADGSRRDVVVTKVLVQVDGHPRGILLSTMMDVSEFREAERAIQTARESAEESSRAKSEFIANISHELRTPLQSILGFSELGLMRGRDQPRLHAMFNDIHASGARMLALVNDLLDVSKIESAVGAITLERADLRALVQAVLHELSPLLSARHLHLAVELGSRPLLAKVDPVRFQQVVRNVVANAIKFSPLGARIDIQGELTDDARVRISVRDHGAGIPPAELGKIFEAFVQSSSSKDGSGGTGLGLAICKKILDAHGGSIVADNMLDGGAVFHIHLPARRSLETETVL